MSAHRPFGRRCGAALAVFVALAFAGCDSNDDDDDDNDGGGDDSGMGPVEEVPGASTFADVIALEAGDDPIALDGEALGADLDRLFGTVTDDPTDVEDDDTVDTLAGRAGRS